MTHNEMIAVIAAHRDGKQVEWRLRMNIGSLYEKWQSCTPKEEPWNFVVAEYRIKPESHKLREWWLIKPFEGDGLISYRAYDCKQDGYENIHVREILPDEGRDRGEEF